MCDMNHRYVWHDSFTCVTWPIYSLITTWVRDVLKYMHKNELIYTWVTNSCMNESRPYMSTWVRDVLIYLSVYEFVMHSYVRHETLTSLLETPPCGPRVCIHKFVTYWYIWVRDPFVYMTRLTYSLFTIAMQSPCVYTWVRDVLIYMSSRLIHIIVSVCVWARDAIVWVHNSFLCVRSWWASSDTAMQSLCVYTWVRDVLICMSSWSIHTYTCV